MRYVLILILGIPIAAHAGECGKDTREQIDSLVCKDSEIIVNALCGTHSGVEQTVLEIVSQREDGIAKQEVALFEKRLKYTLHKHKNESEFDLFRQDTMRAVAITNEDRTSIHELKLVIKPAKGKRCEKTVDIASIWGSFPRADVETADQSQQAGPK